MEVRGERECRECGTRWSYYETGDVACPDCGSLVSVGVDERTRHTDAPVEFDLTEIRLAVDEEPLRRLIGRAAESAREHVRRRGFVDAGELRDLDDTYLAAAELRAVAGAVGRTWTPGDAERAYCLSLLRADVGVRPDPDAVPASMRASRGLAVAAAVDTYREDCLGYLDWIDRDAPTVRAALGTLRGHGKRIAALDGDLPVDETEPLVVAAREVAEALRAGEDIHAERARERLDASTT